MTKENGIIAWSYSRLSCYEQCPRLFKYRNIDKRKEPKAPAMFRGITIHNEAAKFLSGETDVFPESCVKFKAQFYELLELNPIVEQKWAFTKDWATSGYFRDTKTRVRITLDVGLDYKDGHAEVIDHKGLSLKTTLPTPTGFTTMQNVVVGDILFDKDGVTCKVIAKSQVKNIQCYEILFDDTSTVICDEEHIWLLYNGGTKCVTSLRKGDCIPLAGAIKTSSVNLPIPPYTLGAWLGDGHTRGGEITCPDTSVFQRIEEDGFTVHPRQKWTEKEGGCCCRTVKGLGRLVKSNNMAYNKHIPAVYLRASILQRLDLLRGLMDTDGSWNVPRKRAVFSTVDAHLASQVRELVCSLGERATVHPQKAKGFGMEVVVYQVDWSMLTHNPFYLPRKRNKAVFRNIRGHFPGRYIKEITKLKNSVPTQCISVDSPTKTYLFGDRFCPTHNTGKFHEDNPEYIDQGVLFATGLIKKLHGRVNKVTCRLWFLDSGDELIIEYTRAELAEKMEALEERADVMLNATRFPPKPGWYCGGVKKDGTVWGCHFRKSNGGPCEFG